MKTAKANEGVRFLSDILGGYVGGWSLAHDAGQLATQLNKAANAVHDAMKDIEGEVYQRLLMERECRTAVGRALLAAKSDKGAGGVARRYAATCPLPGVSRELRAEVLQLINWRRIGREVAA